MKRIEVSKRLAVWYSAHFSGQVRCYFDTARRAYCIQGDQLPAHPDMRDQYPNGWSLLDFIKPTKARAIVGRNGL